MRFELKAVFADFTFPNFPGLPQLPGGIALKDPEHLRGFARCFFYAIQHFAEAPLRNRRTKEKDRVSDLATSVRWQSSPDIQLGNRIAVEKSQHFKKLRLNAAEMRRTFSSKFHPRILGFRTDLSPTQGSLVL